MNTPTTDESCLEHGKWKHAAGIYRTDGSSTMRLHDKVYLAGLENILIKMALDMRPLDPEYSKVVDDHYWELA